MFAARRGTPREENNQQALILLWIGVFSIISVIVYFAIPIIGYLQVWDLIPSFGIVTFCIALLGILLVLRVLALAYPQRKPLISIWGSLILLWIACLHLVWTPTIIDAGGINVLLETAAKTIVLPCMLWIAGDGLQDISIRTRRRAFGIAYLLLTIITVYGFAKGWITYKTPIFAFKNYANGKLYNYQDLGDSLAIVGLLLMGRYSRDFWANVLIYAATGVLCLIAYSRTSFFLFLIAGGWLLWSRTSRILPKGKLVSLMLLFIVLFAIAGILLQNVNIIGEESPLISRMMILLTDPSSDSSFASRLLLQQNQLIILKHNWFGGQYLADWLSSGITGNYVHNWLSFWIAFGIGPFIAFAIFAFAAVIRVWRYRNDPDHGYKWALLLFGITAITVSRSYVWHPIWFILSLSISFREHDCGKGERVANSVSCTLE